LRSSAVTLFLQAVRYLANLGITMFLARLLTPEDFGVYALAVVFTGLLLLFKDGGVESALVRHGAVSEEECAALASLTALYGLAMAIACAALGPALAWLYEEPRLTIAILLPATAFLLHGLDVFPGALLLRAQRFKVHAVIDLLALLAGLGTALALAFTDAGYWALFAIEPVSALFLLSAHIVAAHWRPRYSLTWRSISHFVRFGGSVSVIRGLGHIAGNIDNILIGLAWGPVPLAFYGRAFRLINLPQEGINWPLSRLAVPLLSAQRNNAVQFVHLFRHFNLISIALGMPCVIFLLISTEDIVAFIYGSQWTAVVPLVRWLGLVGLVNTFLLAPGWVHLATGTVGRQFRWEILNLCVLAAACLCGLPWGPEGVAAAASLTYAALRIPTLLYCFQGTPLRLTDIGGVLWRPLLAAAVAGGSVLLARLFFSGSPPAYFVLLRDGLVLLAGYACGWMLVPGWRRFLNHELRREEAVA
jgi:O-antigen/teichoic acid export membrane protein